MQQPEGFIAKGDKNKVCLLKKSLYGLKQSPRQWYKRFDDYILTCGFKMCNYDSCVYFRTDVDEVKVYLMYVDDILIESKSKEEIREIKKLLSSEFEMKDLGCAKQILGMQIIRERNKNLLFLSQKSYINKVLARFNIYDAKAVTIPLANILSYLQQSHLRVKKRKSI